LYSDLFDKVLLDAPCSGTGVLAKRADLRWRRTLEEVQQLAQLQGELLPAAAKFVKPGGLLVYSTCCLEQEENEDQVAAFLASDAGRDFEVEAPAKGSMPEGMITKEGYLLILPHVHDMDGAFAARLRRKTSS
jgi:16S rRNA (cytosine967-C5)-methyltransferase